MKPVTTNPTVDTMNTTLPPYPVSLAATSILALLCATDPAMGQPFEWKTATPESQGMSRERLDALKDDLAKRKTRAFLVVRNDHIVYEWYAAGVKPESKQGTASLAKAIVGGLSF